MARVFVVGLALVVSVVGVSAPVSAQSGDAPEVDPDQEFGSGSVTATFEGRESTFDFVVEPADPVAGETVTVSVTHTSPVPALFTIGEDPYNPIRPATAADCAVASVDLHDFGYWILSQGSGSTSLDASTDATTAPAPDAPQLDGRRVEDINRIDGRPFECTGTVVGSGVLVWWDITGYISSFSYVIPESTAPGLYALRFAAETVPVPWTYSEVSYPLIRVRAVPGSAPVSGSVEVAPLGGAGRAGDSAGELSLVASVVASRWTSRWLALGSALAAAGVAVLLGASLRPGSGRRGRPGVVLAAVGAGVLAVTVAVAGTDVVGGDAVVPLVGSGVVVVAGLVSPGWALRWLPWVGGLRRRVSPPGGLVVPVATVLYGGFTGVNASLAGLESAPAAALGVAGGVAAGGVALLAVNRSKGREVSRRSAGWAATLLTLVAYATAVVPAVGTDVLTIVAPVVVGVIALVILLRPDPVDPAPPEEVDGLVVVEGPEDGSTVAAVVSDPGAASVDDEVTR